MFQLSGFYCRAYRALEVRGFRSEVRFPCLGCRVGFVCGALGSSERLQLWGLRFRLQGFLSLLWKGSTGLLFWAGASKERCGLQGFRGLGVQKWAHSAVNLKECDFELEDARV